jgi:hypothetical protein
MPIEHALWKLGTEPIELNTIALDRESDLENMIVQNISILSDQWLLIGRQVRTAFNKSVDLLAVDGSGSIIIIELKRNKTPREVVAQAIDYASWVKTLDTTEIAEIYEQNAKGFGYADLSLDQAFDQYFGSRLDEDDLNSSHQMVIVAAQLDSSTERIIRYLNDFGIAINIVFFRVFKDGDNRYLSRAWFIDPAETLEQATAPRGAEPWNGEYYVSFGHGKTRDWNDAYKHGFISAGGGRWYSKTLNKLSPGKRIWVNIPKIGYVGVGIVTSSAVKADEFIIKTGEGDLPLYKAGLNGLYSIEFADDEDKAEYVVGVDWIKKVRIEEAKSEIGFFGNQNSVAQPTSPKWPHTIDRLKVLFGIEQLTSRG